MIQELVAVFVVLLAVAYLVWKFFLARRAKAKGPDVKLSRLRRGR